MWIGAECRVTDVNMLHVGGNAKKQELENEDTASGLGVAKKENLSKKLEIGTIRITTDALMVVSTISNSIMTPSHYQPRTSAESRWLGIPVDWTDLRDEGKRQKVCRQGQDQFPAGFTVVCESRIKKVPVERSIFRREKHSTNASGRLLIELILGSIEISHLDT